MWRFIAVLSCLGSAAVACHAQHDSTWDVIRHDIFGSNCSGCHASGTSFANQSNLLLTPDEAYQQLLDVPAHNKSANDDGLVRASSIGGIVGRERSFLWEKINVAQQDHFFEDHPDYGALMPLGGTLTNGEIEFIGDWLLHGAPETGAVSDVDLLNDTSIYAPRVFEPLPLPEKGIQLHLGPFEAWPAERHDREFLYFQEMAIDEPIYINKMESRYRDGSHHFILYHYEQGERTPAPDEYRDFRDQNGNPSLNALLDASRHSEFLVGSQSPELSYEFPEGVALRLDSTAGFDFNSHSVNRTGESRDGEVYVNLHTTDVEEVIHVAEQRRFGNYTFRLPPNQTTTISKTFTFEETENIIQMWSHAHESMTEFRVEHVGGEKDGELIYWTSDWQHPPLATYDDEPLTFEAGDQVRLVTTYDNQTDQTKRYGLLSSDEMQFLFFVSYPLTGDLEKDGVLDLKDFAALEDKINRGVYTEAFDLNHDSTLDELDRIFWIEKLAGTRLGDVNLDGAVGFEDFLVLSKNFGLNGEWADGDSDGNGRVEFADFLALSGNFGFDNSSPVPIPEPASGALLLASCFTLVVRRRRTRISP